MDTLGRRFAFAVATTGVLLGCGGGDPATQPAPTLEQVVLAPDTATVVIGATAQFAVTGQWSDGASTAPTVTYTATGGVIDAAGLYSAGSTPGTFQTIATEQDGLLADTATVVITEPPPRHYTTAFPLVENPISEGGQWLNGGLLGLDWSNVSTTPGLAIGHQDIIDYSDATALLRGPWGPDQAVSATVHAVSPADSCYQEVELRLRSALVAHSSTGYEITYKVSSTSSAYLQIVRWNGALGDFTVLSATFGGLDGVGEGDVVSATIIGDVITAYKNGLQMAQAWDTTFTTGSPGIGFNLAGALPGCHGTNGNYGFTSVTATDSVAP